MSGEVLTATDLNTTISSLKTTIEGIPNWTKSGSNAYYTDGNVGIGTSSPSSLLHIKGPQNITSRLINLEAPQMSDQSEATIDFTEDNGVVVGRMGLIRDASAPTGFDFFIGNLWNNAVTTSKLFYIRSDGNVGIGTTSPNDKLQVVGDIR
ncbi:MAG: hypothetical protein KDK36_21455, partial [Leptospiraceae bacterium]|nr:hypothetical protein [Leptospiraceae bacterium]